MSEFTTYVKPKAFTLDKLKDMDTYDLIEKFLDYNSVPDDSALRNLFVGFLIVTASSAPSNDKRVGGMVIFEEKKRNKLLDEIGIEFERIKDTDSKNNVHNNEDIYDKLKELVGLIVSSGKENQDWKEMAKLCGLETSFKVTPIKTTFVAELTPISERYSVKHLLCNRQKSDEMARC